MSPKIRPLEALPVRQDGKTLICLKDPLQFSPPVVVSPAAYFIVSCLDGKNSLVDIQAAYCRTFGDLLLTEDLQRLLDLLDRNYLLQNQRFFDHRDRVVSEFRRLSLRPPAHAPGVYPAEAGPLRDQLMAYFRSPEGPGALADEPAAAVPRALVAPHIDYRRGGPCYAWAYQELARSEGADLYVLLGTSHVSGERLFAATAKDFATPLGPVETDREFLRELSRRAGGDLFADEFLHRAEHSLEFQVVFLRFLATAPRKEPWRPFKIAPILVSSFHRFIEAGAPPEESAEARSFFAALREMIAGERRRVCVIAGVDLAHVGLQFGDPEPVSASFLQWVESEDRMLLERLLRLDAEGFFGAVAKDRDRRRICGFAPLYTLARSLSGPPGRLLQYRQAVHPEIGSAVTFGSAVFGP
jgi:AmmeMemoRadiSam system protein B